MLHILYANQPFVWCFFVCSYFLTFILNKVLQSWQWLFLIKLINTSCYFPLFSFPSTLWDLIKNFKFILENSLKSGWWWKEIQQWEKSLWPFKRGIILFIWHHYEKLNSLCYIFTKLPSPLPFYNAYTLLAIDCRPSHSTDVK